MFKGYVNSIPVLIEDFLEKNKDAVVFSHRKGYRTYSVTGKELQDKVNKLRIFLRNKRISKSNTIILLSSNYIEWIAVYFAAILNGVIVVPLDILTDKTLLQRINKQVKAKAIFQDKGLASIKIATYYLDDLEELLKNFKLLHITRVELKPDDILEIMYTSGTTGKPKGVILTHENIVSGLNYTINSVQLIKLRMLNLLPLSHIFGQLSLFLAMNFSQHTFFIDTIQPKKLISFIKNKRIYGTILVPGILASLKKELENKSIIFNLGIQFRLIGVGGAPLDIELEKWWRRKLIKVIQGYGLTETSSIISINSIFSTKIGSVGKIVKGVEVKLNEDNEILVKGKNVTYGYYKDEEKTKNSFEDEWFKTGDVGEIKNSYLYLKERKKDVIITGSGLKAYPVDIENILNSIDGVKESCVIEKDKKIYAVLILNKKVNPSLIIHKANQKLLSHQKISSYSLWHAEFPKTSIGKIKKYVVKEEIGKIKRKEYGYEGKLYKLIHNVLKPHQKITQNSKLVDLGMDSLKRIELISEIENEFGVEIDELKLDQYAKVSDLDKLMEQAKVHKIKFRTWQLNPISELIRLIFQKIFYFLLIRSFTKIYYYGLENIKDIKKPVIFASNHQSAWDGSLIVNKLNVKTAIAADPNIVFGIGTKGILLKVYRKLVGYFTALFYNTYPFGATIGTDTSLESTGELLDRGYSILIFPEASRTHDGKIHNFMPGIGYLALNMDTLIIPVKIKGLFEVLPRGKFVPKFGKTIVKFEKPIFIKNMSYIEATKLIERKVREL